MSTNSSITVKVNDKYKSIYCHYAGYLEWTGKILFENYNSQEKAESLIDGGDLSFIDKSNDCPRGETSNKVEQDGFCVYYKRDRGETNVDPFICNTYQEAMKMNKQEINYLFENGEWTMDGRLLSSVLE